MAEKTIKEKLSEAEKKAKASGVLPFLIPAEKLEEELFGGMKKKKAKKKAKKKMTTGS